MVNKYFSSKHNDNDFIPPDFEDEYVAPDNLFSPMSAGEPVTPELRIHIVLSSGKEHTFYISQLNQSNNVLEGIDEKGITKFSYSRFVVKKFYVESRIRLPEGEING